VDATLPVVKRYAQRCPVARALDVIGERWTPLIVRELMLGPRRYTDLLEALPGVGTNILAGRLSDLQAHGVVVKRTLPPPTPVAVYQLTEAGEALGPVIGELRAWGERFGPPPKAGDAVRPAWILQSAARRSPGLEDGRVCSVQVGDEVFELRGAAGEVAVRAGTDAAPDAVVKLAPRALTSLATGRMTPAQARAKAEVEGDWRVAGDVIEMLAGSVG
jgi:DNA-binding HxlR family transcriptional regulator